MLAHTSNRGPGQSLALAKVLAHGSGGAQPQASADPFAALLAALSSERPIAYSANLGRIAGDVKAGLLLSQMLYWTRVGTDIERNGGWIGKTRQQWTLETGLSRAEQESARKCLLSHGFIQESLHGTPAKLAFKVNLAHVSQALAFMLSSEPVQWSLFDVRSNAQQVRALLGKSLAYYQAYNLVTGSVAASVYLSRAITAHRALLGGGHSPWFAPAQGQWMADTGLTESQLRSCKQKLRQLSIIEQAWMTYPRRKYFIQVNLHMLTQKLMQLRMSAVAHANPQQGLLGLLGVKSHQGKNTSQGQSAKVAERLPGSQSAKMTEQGQPSGSSAPPSPVLSGRANMSQGQSAKMAERMIVMQSAKMTDWLPGSQSVKLTEQGQPSGSSALPSPVLSGRANMSQGQSAKMAERMIVMQSAKMTDWLPGSQSVKLTEQGQPSGSSALPSPVLSSSANFANPVGEFSQVDFAHGTAQNTPNPPAEVSNPANLQASFNTSVGDFSQDQRRVFTPLHARARFLTTNKTTPPPPSTTTSESTNAAPNSQTTQGGGGGVFSDRLIWPLPDAADPKLIALQRMVAAHAFAQTLPFDRLQLILDELASGISKGLVQNPATYLASLLLKEQNGTLILSAAYDWQAQREQRGRSSSASLVQAARTMTAVAPAPVPVAATTAMASKPAAAQDPRALRIWSAVLNQLPQLMSEQHIEVWLKPLTVGLDPSGQKLLLCANRFKCDHIKSAYLEKINIALGQALQSHPELLQVTSCQLVTSLVSAPHQNP